MAARELFCESTELIQTLTDKHEITEIEPQRREAWIQITLSLLMSSCISPFGTDSVFIKESTVKFTLKREAVEIEHNKRNQ